MSIDHRPTADCRTSSSDRLGAALASGQLELPEYERRADLARSTPSTAELAGLTADLAPEPAAMRTRDVREWLDEWRWWLAGVVVLVGTWGVQSAVDGELRNFWPGVPLGIWALVLIGIAIAPRGRDRDD